MRIHHIALRTAALAPLERFYAGVLGLRVVRRTPRSIWLALAKGPGAETSERPLDHDAAWLMLESAEPGEPPIPPGARELVAFAIAPAERATYRARLEAAGVAIEAETPFTLYVRDPDGRRIGLSHYPDDAGAPPT